MKLLALAAACAITALSPQEAPEASQADENHRWLQQIVGDWAATCEATMAPGAEPMRMESTESVRAIGDLWIVAEGHAEIFGTPMTSVMTLGYDPQRKAFVGTWIDSMQTHLWHYEGTLDAARKTLTLNTEGPAFDDPSKTTKYRDVLTVESPDHKVLTSSMLGADGEWTSFMRADFRRKE